MEGNRDEANRCIEIALDAVNSSNYAKAEKFLTKANYLYPTQRAKELLQHVSALSGTKSTRPKTTSNSDGVKKRKTNLEDSNENQKSDENYDYHHNTDYNKEQVDVVQKIKKCKDYYEVLGVAKESTDSEIKKAYKKLALQLHPDKNRAPGAAEAFKAIGNAVAVLTDPRKRKEYDLHGSQTDRNTTTNHYHSRNNEHNSYEYAYARGFESDISADELFNMFFSGFSQQRMNGQRFANHQQHRRDASQQPSFAFGLILLLIMLSMLSSFLTSDPLYSLAQTSKYNIQRRTNHLDIPYYVKENFVEEYQGSLSRLENSVEEDYIGTMKQNCYRERSYRDSMIARARSFGSRSQVAQAQGLKVPSCENLVKIGLTRYAPY